MVNKLVSQKITIRIYVYAMKAWRRVMINKVDHDCDELDPHWVRYTCNLETNYQISICLALHDGEMVSKLVLPTIIEVKLFLDNHSKL